MWHCKVMSHYNEAYNIRNHSQIMYTIQIQRKRTAAPLKTQGKCSLRDGLALGFIEGYAGYDA